jgi:hypothetical protein
MDIGFVWDEKKYNQVVAEHNVLFYSLQENKTTRKRANTKRGKMVKPCNDDVSNSPFVVLVFFVVQFFFLNSI